MASKVMVDSGAHSIFVREVLKKQHGVLNFEYYETDEFWNYVNDYGQWLKENKHLLDVYVSVDVIHSPELSWKVQRHLEDEFGVSPLPVYHSGEDFSWFKKYCDNYEYIGVSGLGQEVSKVAWTKNIGIPVFTYICPGPIYKPTHKIHGFALTSPSLMTSYPWFSVDSTSWVQFGKYGIVIIPYKKNGVYDFTKSPYCVFVSSRPASKSKDLHYDNLVGLHQEYFNEYCEENGFVMGSSCFKHVADGHKITAGEQWADRSTNLVEVIQEKGLSNSHEIRDKINLLYYLDLEKNSPAWEDLVWKPKTVATTLF